MPSKYLAMGKTDYYFRSFSGYAVHIEMDGSVAVAEPTSLSEGYYNQDEKECDNEITDLLENIYSSEVPFDINGVVYTVGDLVDICITGIHSSLNIYEIIDPPKVTKGLADNLEKANEVMAFYRDSKQLIFTGFGVRKAVYDYVSSLNKTVIAVPVLNFYYATNFKGKKLAALIPQTLLVMSENREQVGIVLGVDMDAQTNYRRTMTD